MTHWPDTPWGLHLTCGLSFTTRSRSDTGTCISTKVKISWRIHTSFKIWHRKWFHCCEKGTFSWNTDSLFSGSLTLLFVGSCLCSRGRLSLRVVDLVEHELARDGRLGSVNTGGTPLERRNHLLHHLIEEHVSELGVDEGAKFKGDLRRRRR